MLCDQCTPFIIIFYTHNELMVTYKKLALSLHILSVLNYNQILFAMSFLDMLFVDTLR
jgi:hypothetical protein